MARGRFVCHPLFCWWQGDALFASHGKGTLCLPANFDMASGGGTLNLARGRFVCQLTRKEWQGDALFAILCFVGIDPLTHH